MDSEKLLMFDSCRRFGAEIEICSFDHRDFKAHPLEGNEMPLGIDEVAETLMTGLNAHVIVNKWEHTHNNDSWVLKPDSSAGIEVCSPVIKGWRGIRDVCSAVELMKTNPSVAVDDKCGFHIHVEVADFDEKNLGKALAWWVKCESVFMDSVPARRKRNKYCEQVGLNAEFEHDARIDASWLIRFLGEMKYYTINTYHLCKGKRRTLEFRIIEGEGCLDSYLIKNWMRLLIHFVEMAKRAPWPKRYREGDQWTGYLWLDFSDVMKFLKFDQPLSKGLEETRNWFIARIQKNIRESLSGSLSEKARGICTRQVDEFISQMGLSNNLSKWLVPENLEEALYSKETAL